MARKSVVDIVNDARLGDRSAMESIFQGNYNRVYAFAYTIFGDKDISFDVVKDVFGIIFKELCEYEEFESQAQFYNWLYELTKEECSVRFEKATGNLLPEGSEELFFGAVPCTMPTNLAVDALDDALKTAGLEVNNSLNKVKLVVEGGTPIRKWLTIIAGILVISAIIVSVMNNVGA